MGEQQVVLLCATNVFPLASQGKIERRCIFLAFLFGIFFLEGPGSWWLLVASWLLWLLVASVAFVSSAASVASMAPGWLLWLIYHLSINLSVKHVHQVHVVH